MKYLRYMIAVLAALLLMWIIPLSVDLIIPDKSTNPFVIFSPLDSAFIRFEHQDDGMHYIDFNGVEWTKSEVDSLLPAFAYRQLAAEGRLPDTLNGQAVNWQLYALGKSKRTSRFTIP